MDQTASAVAATTAATTAPVVISTEIVSTKKVILDNPIEKKTRNATTITTPEIHTDLTNKISNLNIYNSKEEEEIPKKLV